MMLCQELEEVSWDGSAISNEWAMNVWILNKASCGSPRHVYNEMF